MLAARRCHYLCRSREGTTLCSVQVTALCVPFDEERATREYIVHIARRSSARRSPIEDHMVLVPRPLLIDLKRPMSTATAHDQPSVIVISSNETHVSPLPMPGLSDST